MCRVSVLQIKTIVFGRSHCRRCRGHCLRSLLFYVLYSGRLVLTFESIIQVCLDHEEVNKRAFDSKIKENNRKP